MPPTKKTEAPEAAPQDNRKVLVFTECIRTGPVTVYSPGDVVSPADAPKVKEAVAEALAGFKGKMHPVYYRKIANPYDEVPLEEYLADKGLTVEQYDEIKASQRR